MKKLLENYFCYKLFFYFYYFVHNGVLMVEIIINSMLSLGEVLLFKKSHSPTMKLV